MRKRVEVGSEVSEVERVIVLHLTHWAAYAQILEPICILETAPHPAKYLSPEKNTYGSK